MSELEGKCLLTPPANTFIGQRTLHADTIAFGLRSSDPHPPSQSAYCRSFSGAGEGETKIKEWQHASRKPKEMKKLFLLRTVR